MVHRVAAGRFARLLLVEDLEFLRGARGRVRVAPQPEEAAIEGGNILREQVRGIALRVDRHEQHLHAIRIGTELFHRLGQGGERRGAHVGTLRIPEKDDDRLPAEIGERARTAVVIGQREIARERGAGHVRRLEFRGRRRARRNDERQKDDAERAHAEHGMARGKEQFTSANSDRATARRRARPDRGWRSGTLPAPAHRCTCGRA